MQQSNADSMREFAKRL